MANEPERHTALSDVAARQLANATKTTPQMKRITPRWLTHLLQWVPVQAGIYRLNRVKDESKVIVDCSDRDERDLPETFVDYEEHPREYMLSAVNTVVDVHTRVSDLYSSPHSQIGEQLRLKLGPYVNVAHLRGDFREPFFRFSPDGFEILQPANQRLIARLQPAKHQ